MPTSFWLKTPSNRQLEYFEPFVGLTPDQSRELRARMQRCSFPAGERFMRAGEVGDGVYLIADGKAEVRRPDGQVLATLGKGHFVGEMALLNREPRMADVVASTKLRAWRLAREDFEPLVEKLPALRLFLTRLVAHRLQWSGKDLLSRRIGNYEIVEGVGKGGMGWVFRAIQLPQEREVAVKMLPHALVTRHGFLERFRIEAQILGRLRHENIVSVLDTIEAYGTMFIVMEFVRGITAHELAHQAGNVAPNQVRAIAAAVAKALQHAHKEGIIHRDVKPDNIMIRADGCVKLMDFGIAQQLQGGLSRPGGFTPQYAAPEVMRDESVSPAADYYSLGVTLYEILTGQLPFEGSNTDDWAHLHCQTEPRPLRSFSARVPADLDAIVSTALIKDPTRRWAELEPLLKKLSPHPTTMTPAMRLGTRATPLLVLWLQLPGEREERALMLDRPLLIGRSQNADIRLSDPAISGRHCLISPRADGVEVLDLESRNGTYVNSQRVPNATLHVGDQVRLGLTMLSVDKLSTTGVHITMINLAPVRPSSRKK